MGRPTWEAGRKQQPPRVEPIRNPTYRAGPEAQKMPTPKKSTSVRKR